MSDDKVPLTAEQAISMLPDGESVHTFRDMPGIMLGADWNRDTLIEAIRNSKCEVGGKACQGMNHGLVVWTDGPLFVECREDVDYEQFASVKEI